MTGNNRLSNAFEWINELKIVLDMARGDENSSNDITAAIAEGGCEKTITLSRDSSRHLRAIREEAEKIDWDALPVREPVYLSELEENAQLLQQALHDVVREGTVTQEDYEKMKEPIRKLQRLTISLQNCKSIEERQK